MMKISFYGADSQTFFLETVCWWYSKKRFQSIKKQLVESSGIFSIDVPGSWNENIRLESYLDRLFSAPI